jgi:hypothetical protein
MEGAMVRSRDGLTSFPKVCGHGSEEAIQFQGEDARHPLRVALSNRTVDSGMQRCRYDYDRHRVELSVTVSFDGKAFFVNLDHRTGSAF